MNKGIYRIAAGIGAAVILVSSCTVQASMVMTNGTPAAVATDSIANWPAAPAVTSETAVLMDADTGTILYNKGMDTNNESCPLDLCIVSVRVARNIWKLDCCK